MKKSYRAIAGDLKKLGLVKYDLRKPLSRGQKSQITKLTNRLADVFGSEKSRDYALKNPGQFQVLDAPKSTVGDLIDAGFKVLPNGKAIIPKKGAQRVTLGKADGVNEVRYFFAGRKEQTPLVQGLDGLSHLKKLIKKKRPRNQMVTARVGDNAPFQNARFDKAEDLYKYLSAWKPKDDDKNKVLGLLSIVTVYKDAPKKAPAKKKRRN